LVTQVPADIDIESVWPWRAEQQIGIGLELQSVPPTRDFAKGEFPQVRGALRRRAGRAFCDG
jgi:hypothetical protein